MVRRLHKPSKGVEALKELELATDNEVANIHSIRKRDFKSEMNAGFYFSVVFDTKDDRDIWLKKRNLKLVDDIFIKINDFKV
jgi:hypothetical protein